MSVADVVVPFVRRVPEQLKGGSCADFTPCNAMLALSALSPLSSTARLHLEYGASVVPHPSKVRSGGTPRGRSHEPANTCTNYSTERTGEDAHMIIGRLLRARGEREVTGAFAVFDGVGAWVNEGVDSGVFSRALSRHTRDGGASPAPTRDLATWARTQRRLMRDRSRLISPRAVLAALSRQSWASSLDLTAALSSGLRATQDAG